MEWCSLQNSLTTMKKTSIFLCFLILACALLSTLVFGDTSCSPIEHNKNSPKSYRCTKMDGFLRPIALKDDGVSPLLIHLDLSKNKLSLSDKCFKWLTDLKTLDLSHGSLSRLSKNYFSGLNKLKTLDLSNNNIKSLPQNVFDEMPNLREVRLHNNKWDCKCKKGLKNLLDSKQNINLGPVPALCVKPSSFKDAKKQINQSCDVNECLYENDCDDVATCKDFPFHYSCECSTKGFTGTGKECIDIDECSGSNPSNDCAEIGGVCINTHGSYKCKCEKGYKGNGKQCTDINECVEHDCDQGDCQNTQGSFRCDCFSGYAMNAERVCVDVDECEIGNNTCEAIPHSYCVNLEKFLPEDEGYRCKCETGYKKVGKSCVFEGNMKEWIKFLAIIIGGFVGILFLIILCAVIFSKWRNRTPKSEKKDEVVVAPVGLAPPVVFGYLDMPQTQQTGQDEDDWKELEDEDVEDDDAD